LGVGSRRLNGDVTVATNKTFKGGVAVGTVRVDDGAPIAAVKLAFHAVVQAGVGEVMSGNRTLLPAASVLLGWIKRGHEIGGRGSASR